MLGRLAMKTGERTSGRFEGLLPLEDADVFELGARVEVQ